MVLSYYWDKLSVMYQDFTKYELSLSENILLDYNSIEKFKELEELTKLLDPVFVANHSLDTQLGFWFDDGKQLSGGEWSKIALLRALIRKSEFIILDEPTAAVDIHTRKNISQLLNMGKDNRITLIVTHDINDIKFKTDKIIFLDDGKVEAFGNLETVKRNKKFNDFIKSKTII